jgi:ADP-ribosylglycohydrolase
MRAAPAGLFALDGDLDAAYELGCDIAALTHGDRDAGWQPAGLVAVVVAALRDGQSVHQAVAIALPYADPHMTWQLRDAIEVAADGLPTAAVIEDRLGGGWHGDEALGIAVACALAAPDFASGVIAAANHSGDTDSTASICGNLLGTLHGRDAIPTEWLDALDSRDLVETIAADFVTEVTEAPESDEWWQRYPGW